MKDTANRMDREQALQYVRRWYCLRPAKEIAQHVGYSESGTWKLAKAVGMSKKGLARGFVDVYPPPPLESWLNALHWAVACDVTKDMRAAYETYRLILEARKAKQTLWGIAKALQIQFSTVCNYVYAKRKPQAVLLYEHVLPLISRRKKQDDAVLVWQRMRASAHFTGKTFFVPRQIEQFEDFKRFCHAALRRSDRRTLTYLARVIGLYLGDAAKDGRENAFCISVTTDRTVICPWINKTFNGLGLKIWIKRNRQRPRETSLRTERLYFWRYLFHSLGDCSYQKAQGSRTTKSYMMPTNLRWILKSPAFFRKEVLRGLAVSDANEAVTAGRIEINLSSLSEFGSHLLESLQVPSKVDHSPSRVKMHSERVVVRITNTNWKKMMMLLFDGLQLRKRSRVEQFFNTRESRKNDGDALYRKAALRYVNGHRSYSAVAWAFGWNTTTARAAVIRGLVLRHQFVLAKKLLEHAYRKNVPLLKAIASTYASVGSVKKTADQIGVSQRKVLLSLIASCLVNRQFAQAMQYAASRNGLNQYTANEVLALET